MIGVDATAELTRELSHRASRKPTRGGMANVLFGRLSLDEAPGDLVQLAEILTVLFPWGSLLRAVAVPVLGDLRKLAALGKPSARVRLLYGYGDRKDAGAVDELGWPDLGAPSALRTLEAAYARAGLQVQARYPSREEVASIQSTWAKKLSFSGSERTFVELLGRVGASSEGTA